MRHALLDIQNIILVRMNLFTYDGEFTLSSGDITPALFFKDNNDFIVFFERVENNIYYCFLNKDTQVGRYHYELSSRALENNRSDLFHFLNDLKKIFV